MTTHAKKSERGYAEPGEKRRNVTVPTPVVEAGTFAPVPVAGLVGGLIGTALVSPALHRRRADDDILGGTEVPASTQAVLSRRRGRGSSLPQGFARRMERGFGVPLGDVRVHTDGESGELARQMQSTAFTLGSDIYFSRGSYAPSTARGQHLLAHELAHVAQQPSSAGSGRGSSAVTVGHAADPAEAQADRVADTVLRTLGAGDGCGAAPPVAPAVGGEQRRPAGLTDSAALNRDGRARTETAASHRGRLRSHRDGRVQHRAIARCPGQPASDGLSRYCRTSGAAPRRARCDAARPAPERIRGPP